MYTYAYAIMLLAVTISPQFFDTCGMETTTVMYTPIYYYFNFGMYVCNCLWLCTGKVYCAEFTTVNTPRTLPACEYNIFGSVCYTPAGGGKPRVVLPIPCFQKSATLMDYNTIKNSSRILHHTGFTSVVYLVCTGCTWRPCSCSGTT